MKYIITVDENTVKTINKKSKAERDRFCLHNTDKNVFVAKSKDPVVVDAKSREGQQGWEPQIVHVSQNNSLVGVCDDGETARKVCFLGWPPEAADIDPQLHGDNADALLSEYERKFGKPFFGSFKIRYDYEV